MKTVMVSGHFDPFHDMHLDYFEQAAVYGDELICIVSSDRQLLMKKGKVNIPEEGRRRIVDLVLRGIGWLPHETVINVWDADGLITDAIRFWRPQILCRGGDKTLDDMALPEPRACDDLGIKIIPTVFKADRHGSQMVDWR